MCIIILDTRRDSKRVSRDVLKRCYEKNKHGMGIMWATGTALKTWRSLDDFEGLWNRYTGARDFNYPVAVHFRFNTRGQNTIENCHPFTIADGFAFMHNGTIAGITNAQLGDLSDSQYVNKHLFQELPGDFLNKPVMKLAVERLLGTDRMLFMDRTGAYCILNEHTGIWEWGSSQSDKGGVWFSHTRDRQYFVHGTNTQPAVTGFDPNRHTKPYVNKYIGKDEPAKTQHNARVADRRSSVIVTTTPAKDVVKAGVEVEVSRYEKWRQQAAEWGRKVRGEPKEGASKNLIFDFGGFTNKLPDDYNLVGPARLAGAILWGAITAEGTIPVAVAASSAKGIVGKIYAISGDSVTNELNMLDDEEGPAFERRLMKAVHDEYGTMEVWVYTLSEGRADNYVEVIAPCPEGNWEKWNITEEEVDAGPVAVVKDTDLCSVGGKCGPADGLAPELKRNDGYGLIRCRLCKSEHTQLYADSSRWYTKNPDVETVTMFKCYGCNSSMMYTGREEWV